MQAVTQAANHLCHRPYTPFFLATVAWERLVGELQTSHSKLNWRATNCSFISMDAARPPSGWKLWSSDVWGVGLIKSDPQSRCDCDSPEANRAVHSTDVSGEDLVCGTPSILFGIETEATASSKYLWILRRWTLNIVHENPVRVVHRALKQVRKREDRRNPNGCSFYNIKNQYCYHTDKDISVI